MTNLFTNFKRIFYMVSGLTIASLGISCVINSKLGCFSVTTMNMAFANWFGISLGMAGMIVELIILLIATYRGEGIGLTSIVNATYGSLMIDAFCPILPNNPLLILGVILLPLGWSIIGSKKVGFGDTGTNILMNSILKQSKKNIGFIRMIQEGIYMSIGFLGAKDYITLTTLILTFGLGYLLQIVYKILKYNPVETEHMFLIKGKMK